MRTQEFNSKHLPSPARRGSRSRPPLRRPRPLRFERLRVGGEGKADANLTNFLSTCCAWAPQLACHALGRLPTPPPLPENLLLRLHRKLPSAPPASTTCKPHSSRGRGRPKPGPSQLRGHGRVSGLIFQGDPPTREKHDEPALSPMHHSAQFRSNKLLATKGRETRTTLRVWVTGGGSPREFVC